MQYKVNWKYKSSIGGPWEAGDVVEIDDAAVAEAINIDSPGVLEPLFLPSKNDGTSPALSPKAGKGAKKSKDRQVKAAETREFVMSSETPGYGADLVKSGQG